MFPLYRNIAQETQSIIITVAEELLQRQTLYCGTLRSNHNSFLENLYGKNRAE